MGTTPGGSPREAGGGGEDDAPCKGETGAGPPGEVADTGPVGGVVGA
jgi:hypothetical protein